LLVVLQLAYPDRVEGLMLVNGTASQAGWVEWGYQKVKLKLKLISELKE